MNNMNNMNNANRNMRNMNNMNNVNNAHNANNSNNRGNIGASQKGAKPSVNPKNLDALLSIVGKKLGMSPQELRRQLESGKFDAAMSNMTPQEAQTFNKVINDPQLADKVISAPQAQSLYKKLSGEK